MPQRSDSATDRPDVPTIARWWSDAIEADPELAHERSIVFHDLGMQDQRFDDLVDAFPSTALHAVAIKANPIVSILRRLVERGAGLEAASIEEVHIAVAAGCPPERIVFDSPAKTEHELQFALDRGMTINVDNRDELGLAMRMDRHPTARIGLRVNPARSDGSIAATSVGGPSSRFGVSLEEVVDQILPMLGPGNAIDGLHVHVGSQGCELDQLADSVAAIDDLADHVVSQQGTPLSFVDIGGGLPTDYGANPTAPSYIDYAEVLRARVPRLWDHTPLITEFGRSLLAGCGVAVTRVQFVKRPAAARPTAVVHLGADFLLRAAYDHVNWPYRFSSLTGSNDRAIEEWDVAGPLCFAGDVIGRRVPLPEPRPGDLLAIHDVGAYSLSMWSRHCSRGMPAVIGIAPDDRFVVLLDAERPDDVVRFWSRGATPGPSS